ncbi:hypothetical protein RD055328_01390 [Companilactobacillus sp. RD055328]|uniref:hypothetical protein n=1 Tax=Companilactobacillus sp. RD055328 TaxID=2916634 RepID=UPI001FC8D5CA|nr:hypothetical protein [Companilactobacillus sp. RD055328]GKQ42216.1 hypothetical protein RD055328_01390 [Companilactobacillus sp. RD055328]
MQKYLDKLKEVNRKWIISAIAVLVIIFGFLFWNSHRKYDVSDQINVSFSGYNGRGTAHFDGTASHKKIFELVGKREGLKQEDIDRIIANDMEYDDMIDIYAKAAKTEDLTNMVSVDLSKDDNLSNGDKIKLKVVVPSKEIPIKEVTKTLTVKGLKKVKTVDVKDIKSNLKIKFEGVSGLGKIRVNSNKYKDMVLNVKKNGKLKNNDKVKIVISKQDIEDMESNGKKFEGSRSFETTVSGLQDVNEISNIEDVINLNTALANDENESGDATTYKVELVHSYIENNADDDYSKTSSQVSVNDNSDMSNTYNVFGMYKVTTISTYNNKAEVQYVQYGYEGLEIEDHILNIDDKNTDDSIQDKVTGKTLEIVQHNLGSRAVMIK